MEYKRKTRNEGPPVALKEILIYGSPMLREKAEPIDNLNGQIIQLCQDMQETMIAANGLGLAAPQVGIAQRLIIVGDPQDTKYEHITAIVNPEVVESYGGEESFEEGCLSIPEIRGEVLRPKKVIIQGYDLEGRPIQIETEGMAARALQHEVDHLNGILFIDYLGPAAKTLIKPKLKKLQEFSQKEKMKVRL
jgi:peptide deformylase